jgi:hypothetical protein
MLSAQQRQLVPDPDFLRTVHSTPAGQEGSRKPYGNGHWVRAQFAQKDFNTLEDIRDALDTLDIYFHFGPRGCEHDPHQHLVYLYFGPKLDTRTKQFLRATTGLREGEEFSLYEPLFDSIEVPWSEVRLRSVNFHWLCKSRLSGQSLNNHEHPAPAGHPRHADKTLPVPKVPGQHTRYWNAKIDERSYRNGATGSGGCGGAATGGKRDECGGMENPKAKRRAGSGDAKQPDGAGGKE